MDLSTLKNPNQKTRKRVGRGPASGTGKTSGRGQKGQKARSGYSRRSGFEGGQMPLNRRLPKRGFNHEKRFPLAVVNLDAIDKTFEAGTEITNALLVEKDLAHETKGGVKVLGRGEITKALSFKVAQVSASAKAKIEAAGGSVELTVPAASKAAETAAAAAETAPE